MDLGNMSINELEPMMETADMKLFCAVAQALVQIKSKDAYNILKKHVFNTDIYKRRYVISIIFEYPDAIEIVDELSKELRIENNKPFMVNTILSVMIKYNIKIDAEIVVQALIRSDFDYGWYYMVIALFDKNERNLDMLMFLYSMKRKCTSIRIFMAEQLSEFVTEGNYMQLFQLFEKDEQPQIRMVACNIANKMNRQDLLLSFKDDKDGHIRKYVIKNTRV